MTDKRFKGAVMDYINYCDLTLHNGWEEFMDYCQNRNNRLILATTKTQQSFYDYNFIYDDIVLFGKETSGVPDIIHKTIKEKIIIPMSKKTRSLNLATSVSIVASRIISQL
jgi:tRNA (cytidine/uridine-2'-O-)-methyltransferase